MVKAKEQEKVKEEELLQLQLVEQSLQNLLLQKQAFQLELVEIENALSELKKLKKEEVFKIVGTLMIKSDKENLIPELEKKHDVLEIRIKSIEKQEQELREKLLKMREELLKKFKS